MRKQELPFIRHMFNHISARYDFLNRLISLNCDQFWRRRLIDAVSPPAGGRVLDVACGTADVALQVAANRQTMVVGADFALGMLAVANLKIEAAGYGRQIQLIAADALRLPFKDGLFDGVTIAFGIRNIMDRPAALQFFYNQLKPGGKLGILELSVPGHAWLKALYRLYALRLLPKIGQLVSGSQAAYRYLPESVLKFPEPPQMAAMMRRAGFAQVAWRPLTGSVVCVYVGTRGNA